MTSTALPARFMEPKSNTKVDRKLTKHWCEMSWLLWLGDFFVWQLNAGSTPSVGDESERRSRLTLNFSPS